MENKTAQEIVEESSELGPGDSLMFEGSGMSGKKIFDSREFAENRKKRLREIMARKASRFLCRNASLDWNEKGNISVTGCQNEKRNGSRYCQDCSDKHKGIIDGFPKE